MKKNHIKYESEIDLLGFKIPCYISEDSTRILSASRVKDVLNMADEKDGKGLEINLEPITCYKGDQKIAGYEATKLVDLCKAFVEAKKHKNLSPKQEMIAQKCEILLRNFAKFGIVTLVDEATNYSYKKEKVELQKILKSCISQEVSKWQKEFPLSFYWEIFRLKDIPFTAENIKQKPRFISYLTNELVYKHPKKGIEALEKKKEKTSAELCYRHRINQALVHEIAHHETSKEELKKVIHTIEALASVSDNWRQFSNLIKKRFHPEQDLPLINVESMERYKTEGTDFDRAIDKLLNNISKNHEQQR